MTSFISNVMLSLLGVPSIFCNWKSGVLGSAQRTRQSGDARLEFFAAHVIRVDFSRGEFHVLCYPPLAVVVSPWV